MDSIRLLLSPDMKLRLGQAFPRLYRLYERRYILNTLKLLPFYDKNKDCLNINGAVFSMNQITSAKLLGVFNSEFPDIIQPEIYGTDEMIPYNEGPYEYGEVRLSGGGEVIIDCGANIGLFSAVASSKGCKVYAFEPIPYVIDELKIAASNNRGITVCPYAVSSESGSIEAEASGLSESTISSNRMKGKSKNVISINSISLDKFVENNNIDKVAFIKADIEGAERDMLKGATNILKTHAPKLSICTYHYEDDKEVLERLILDANPRYKVTHAYKKLYAYVP